MRSKKFLLIFGIASSFLITSCGIMGQKEDIKKLIELKTSSGGCLNEFGPNVEKFMEGNISTLAWTNSWDCTLDSLDLFEQFVKGSVADGYNQADIENFVGKFLVTDKKVSKELIDASFALKASIFGGSREVLTKDELKKFMKLIRIGRNASIELIPHLKNRHENPSAENLLLLSDAIKTFAESISDGIDTNGNLPLKIVDAQNLLDEIAKLHDWEIGHEWVAPVIKGKQLLFGGSGEAIEGKLWPLIFKRAGAMGGPTVAIASANKDRMEGPNEYGNFIVNLSFRLKQLFEITVDYYGGVIPYEVFYSFIDSIPNSWIDIDRNAIKDSLRPVFSKVFKGGTEVGVSKAALNLMQSLADSWNQRETHLDKIFSEYKLDVNGVSKEAFIDAASRYSTKLNTVGQNDVAYLISIIQKYRPLFNGSDNMITFIPMVKFSKGHLSKILWMSMTSRHALEIYGSDRVKKRATEMDLKQILVDFNTIGIATHYIDPTQPDVYRKRFNEADLFTFASNGDGYLTEDEVTYYLADIYSAAQLTFAIEDDTQPVCKTDKKDPLDWFWMDPACFRHEFFSKVSSYWVSFPLLFQHYNSLSAKDQDAMRIAYEKAGRRYGYTNLPVGKTDGAGFATIPHYIETIFMKYDKNGDQKLDEKEIETAYPDFKTIIAKSNPKADPNDDATLLAGFTYVVKFGKSPDTTSVGGVAHFLWWKAWKKFWKIDAYRKTVYEIIPTIAGGETPPPGTPNP